MGGRAVQLYDEGEQRHSRVCSVAAALLQASQAMSPGVGGLVESSVCFPLTERPHHSAPGRAGVFKSPHFRFSLDELFLARAAAHRTLGHRHHAQPYAPTLSLPSKGPRPHTPDPPVRPSSRTPSRPHNTSSPCGRSVDTLSLSSREGWRTQQRPRARTRRDELVGRLVRGDPAGGASSRMDLAPHAERTTLALDAQSPPS